MADWRHKAVCHSEDPELFFPIGRSGPAELQIELAKSICRRCPVASECLTWALETGQEFGVWGGMSEEERRALKRRGFRPVSAQPKVPECRQKHPLTEDNIRIDAYGTRRCRACHNASQAKSHARQREAVTSC